MKNTLTLIVVILIGFTAQLHSATGKMSSSKSSTTRKAPTTAERANLEKETAKKLTSALTSTQKSKLLALLNEGSSEDLVAIKGIAKTRAASIVKARPYKEIDEVILVEGVGEGTFTNVVAHGKSLTQRSSSKKKAS